MAHPVYQKLASVILSLHKKTTSQVSLLLQESPIIPDPFALVFSEFDILNYCEEKLKLFVVLQNIVYLLQLAFTAAVF